MILFAPNPTAGSANTGVDADAAEAQVFILSVFVASCIIIFLNEVAGIKLFSGDALFGFDIF